jgi:hypothetical protein
MVLTECYNEARHRLHINDGNRHICIYLSDVENICNDPTGNQKRLLIAARNPEMRLLVQTQDVESRNE